MELRPDVVAGKYDPLKFDPSGKTLLVNEIFYSIQGEGYHAGEACVFIRLAKCNLACKFCDTEFETGAIIGVESIVAEVLNLCHAREGVQVTLTGGEPMLQNCGLLVNRLNEIGYYTTIETSGSVWSPWAAALHWRTVSPKVRFDDIPDDLKKCADEFKWIVNAAFLTQFERHWAQCWAPSNSYTGRAPANYLQPEWGPNREKYTTAAIKLVLKYPNIYQLSLQQHKLAGVP